MKKRTKIVLPLLLVLAMVLTALSVFIFTATAANADEASIKAVTITYATGDSLGATHLAESKTTAVPDSSKSGSFKELAAGLANLAPTTPTRYMLTLKSDITVSEAVSISGNENTEIWIDLAGHTVTSTVNGPAFVVSGTGATVRFFGEFNEDGTYGAFKTDMANGAFVKISSGSTAYVDVNYVDCSFTASADGAAMFIAEGGKLTFEHSSITHTSGNRANMFDVKGAALNLKYSTFMGDKSATLVKSSASDVYIEGGELIGYSVVTSDGTASDIIVTGLTCEVDTAFVQGSPDTRTYVLGSTMEIYTAIASGSANASNLTFYYGDGAMSIVGQDMADYGIANSDVFEVTEAGGVWSMEYKGANKVVTTVAVIGNAPVVQFFDAFGTAATANLADVGNDTYGVTDATVRIVTLLANTSGTVAVQYFGSEDTSIIIDFNGHTHSYTSSSSNTMFQIANQLHLRIDGADASGNKGKLLTGSKQQRLVYLRQGSKSGQISKHLVAQISNISIEATNLQSSGAGAAGIIDAPAGYMFINNMDITYSGTKVTADNLAATDSSGASTGNDNNARLVNLSHSSFASGVVFINNLTLSDTSTNGMLVNGINSAYSWRVFASNLKTVGVDDAIKAGSNTAKFYINNSDISSVGSVFSGSGIFYVTDTTINAPTGTLVSGTATAHFHYGTGKTTINVGDATLTGTTKSDDGYSVVEVSKGVYEVVSGDFNHSITMPAVFSNGMMLQRGKVVNIYGYCKAVGDTISVKIGDATKTGTVGDDKSWKVSFPPMAAAEGVTIEIDQVGKGEDVDVTISNVNIGEIWVMSGQSNASLFSGYLEDVDELALLSETLNIREFTSNGYSLNPDPMGNGSWKRVTASVVKEKATYAMSAAGYATVAKLSAELGPDVPVGLITIAQGSTKINTWLDYENIAELSPWLAARYDSIKANGTLPSGAHGGSAVPTILYNRHVYPLEGFTAAGVMWYQGCGDIPGKYYKESDAGDSGIHFLGPEGKTYTDFFTKLEDVFRRAFDNGGTELPFYVMQLAPYSRSGDGPGDGSYIYSFRLEQYEMCKKLDNTYLVSIANEGMAFTSQDVDGGAFIHPARKSPIGNRTADMILANHYNIKNADVVSYPVPLSAVMNANGTVTVTFDTELKLFMGDTVEGFELYNGTAWVKASGVIDGNKLILSAPGVSSAKSVRYGFGSIQVELENGRIIEVTLGNYTLNSNKTVYDVTDALTGEHVFIDVDSNDVIRTKNHGNITNASGVPLVLFQVDVAAE